MVQQLRKSITALAFFGLSAAAAAQAPSTPLTLKPDAPDRYVVVPGDTLWGILQRYTDSPWRWPELWGLNKDEIRNPHLIYPGYVIILDRSSGRLRILGSSLADPDGNAEGLPGCAGLPAASACAACVPGPPMLSRPLDRSRRMT